MARRFCLTGDMANLYSFIQVSLEWPFSELVSANVSLWNQCKYIAFNIFSCRILIFSYKMLIITETSNEKNKWIKHIWNIMLKRHNILPTRTSFFIQLQEKLKAWRSSKLNFLSSCFIANDSYIKIVWLNIVVFSKHDILHFWDNLPQNCFNFFNYSNQTCTQVFKFSFALDK